MKFKNIFLTLLAATVAGFTMTGCNDNNNNEKGNILHPIAEHVIGKWSMVKSQMKQDGKWVEAPIPEGSGLTYTLRTDGTVLSALTAPDGYTKLNPGEWKVDEATGKLTLGTMTVDVLNLDATSLVMGHDVACNPETGEPMEGEFRWTLARMDESRKTLAEQLVGKWNFSKSCEKKDGEWVEITYGVPDEGWHRYREDATWTAYSRRGENEKTIDMNWAANTTTGVVRFTGGDGQASTVKVAIEADGTLSLFYENNVDPSTGQVVTGEYKDVLVRAQE